MSTQKQKIVRLLFVSLFLLTIASCEKTCVCYEPVNGTMTMRDVFASNSKKCTSLSTARRTCVEESERVDPSQIAIDMKKKGIH